jgi:hypothetical protein
MRQALLKTTAAARMPATIIVARKIQLLSAS